MNGKIEKNCLLDGGEEGGHKNSALALEKEEEKQAFQVLLNGNKERNCHMNGGEEGAYKTSVLALEKEKEKQAAQGLVNGNHEKTAFCMEEKREGIRLQSWPRRERRRSKLHKAC